MNVHGATRCGWMLLPSSECLSVKKRKGPRKITSTHIFLLSRGACRMSSRSGMSRIADRGTRAFQRALMLCCGCSLSLLWTPGSSPPMGSLFMRGTPWHLHSSSAMSTATSKPALCVGGFCGCVKSGVLIAQLGGVASTRPLELPPGILPRSECACQIPMCSVVIVTVGTDFRMPIFHGMSAHIAAPFTPTQRLTQSSASTPAGATRIPAASEMSWRNGWGRGTLHKRMRASGTGGFDSRATHADA